LGNNEWKSVYSQIVAAGYAEIDIKGYGGLSLTNKGRTFLKSKEKIYLRKEVVKAKKAARRVHERTSAELPDLEYSHALFEELRQLRLDISKEKKVPPYVIFHDRTLKEIASRRPVSLKEMDGLYGVGDIKLKKFGQMFVDFMIQYTREHGSDDKIV
jgi:ATP-dependent DNA helicase RecQ